MTFRFCDGFDSYTTVANLTAKWSTVAGASFAATAGRFGGGAVFNSGSGLNLLLTKAVTIPIGSRVRLAMSLKYSAGTVAYGLNSGNPLLAINAQQICGFTSLGLIVVTSYGGGTAMLTSSVAVNDGNFHWIELEYYLNGASSTAQLFIDGVSQGTYTGSLGSQVAISSVSFGMGYVFSGTGWLDDAIVWDDQGSSFNTFPLGPRRISTLLPNADGDLAQFTPKTGTSHFAMVNGGYSSTNYVSDTGTGNVDLFKFPALAYTPTSINLVVGYFFGQNTGSGSTSLTPKLKTGGTTISGATQTLPVGTYTVTQAPFLTDAGGAAWTAAAVNAMQIGMGD
ncbi:MAG: hypothetical protein ACOYB2_07545 [Limnohabitans sp.]